ncbi:MAG: isopentenyl phosphate kinase [Chloroflexota bacterium]
MSGLIFLKLGGSLITEKHTPMTPRLEVISRLAEEIAEVKNEKPGLQLVLGHGSGSFGHTPANQHGTRQGVNTPEQWRGFHEVWLQARRLNSIVIDALHQTGIAAMSFPVSAGARTSEMKIVSWDLTPMQAALQSGILPVVYGDVVFDEQIGGTILSTEDIFRHLTGILNPQQILLAGLEPGVWADYPQRSQLVKTITPENFDSLIPAIAGAAETDVTGGMRSKVQEMLQLVKIFPDLEICIFSGDTAGQIKTALLEIPSGTRIKNLVP